MLMHGERTVRVFIRMEILRTERLVNSLGEAAARNLDSGRIRCRVSWNNSIIIGSFFELTVHGTALNDNRRDRILIVVIDRHDVTGDHSGAGNHSFACGAAVISPSDDGTVQRTPGDLRIRPVLNRLNVAADLAACDRELTEVIVLDRDKVLLLDCTAAYSQACGGFGALALVADQ